MALSRCFNDRLIAGWRGPADWVSSAIVNNPLDTAVLLDTDVLSVGRYQFVFSGWADAAETLDIQHRNAANGATLDSKRRAIAANGNDDTVIGDELVVAQGERVRVVQVGNLTGNVQVSLHWREVATP